MCELVIFGGTTEGRKLADYCARHEICAAVCVVSEYGETLLPVSPYIEVCRGAKTQEDMEDMFCQKRPCLVFDATHPYAAAVTDNVRQACGNQNITYVRVTRDSQAERAEGPVTWVRSAQEAAEYLSSTEGNILLTTGSKELEIFSHIRDFESRVYARVLPDEKAVRLCRELGLAGSHIVAMQGPFSPEMNRAVMGMVKAKYLVTKESGTAGGFLEKMEAAAGMNVEAVVIGRPGKPDGVSVAEAIRMVSLYGRPKRCRVSLVGIGMGGEGQLTGDAVRCLENAQAVVGARRMVKSVGKWCREKEVCVSYKPDEIIRWLEDHPYIEEAVMVYSGDTGFYSGAGAMAESLGRYPDRYDVVMVPGISTVSFLCARLKTSWEDVYLGSLHGRKADVGEMLKHHRRVFLLMEGRKSVDRLCRELTAAGYGKVKVSVGESLSYPQERVVVATAQEVKGIFIEEESGKEGPCAVLLEQV